MVTLLPCSAIQIGHTDNGPGLVLKDDTGKTRLSARIAEGEPVIAILGRDGARISSMP
jgi:hypothetical protein